MTLLLQDTSKKVAEEEEEVEPAAPALAAEGRLQVEVEVVAGLFLEQYQRRRRILRSVR